MLIPLQHLSDIDFVDFSKDDSLLPDLPHVIPIFFVPPLEDVPQNPIMDNLKIEEINLNSRNRTNRFKNCVEIEVKDDARRDPLFGSNEETREVEVETLWKAAATQKIGNGLVSWDRLRATHPTKASSRTAFLSEQDEFMLSSARYHVQPLLRDSTHVIATTTHHELLTCLKTTVLGISSRLHIWNSTLERFVQAGTGKSSIGVLLVDGKDSIMTESFTARLLTIGTLLRRLESLVSSLRTRSAKEGPTIHSLAHSLSTTLDYIRQKLMECPPNKVDLMGETCLAQIWSCYAPYEEILIALADLCGRSESFKTTEYFHLESDPVPLLSRLYQHLSLHFERQSSHLIRSVMAFLVSSTSHEYIQQVAHSIGFGGQPRPKSSKRETLNEFDIDDDDEEEEHIFDLLDDIETRFPDFFPPEMLNLLPAAQKSLVLLRVAQPDHAFLVTGSGSPDSKVELRWLWKSDEVEAAWNGLPLPSPTDVSLGSGDLVPLGPSDISYRSELSAFRVFDLEPGIGTVESIGHLSDTDNCSGTSAAILSSFISSFPSSLPSITPTLSSLASLTFQRLTEHASTLSKTLLHIFVDKPGKLNFYTHLILLRDFLLVSKPEFKAKLIIALFHDGGEFCVESSSAHSLSVRAVRKRQRERYSMTRKVDKQGGEGVQSHKDQGGRNPWAVGLAPHLLERETWPPVGADLAFYLRTVIVDSLDWTERKSRKGDGEELEGRGSINDAIVLEEAEWRLGFAIKDLPVGSGKEKWMEPLSIEALDFLYMDYKPPRPLEVLISPEVLSKYQRMFTFILRLLRVENALKSLFRMSTSRTDGTFLFPTLAKSRQLLLHFRFVAQAFVSSLSGYVFDSVIGGNFDPFLSQLSFSHDVRRLGFSDVFELAQCHLALLNDLLSACLLRSGQKGVGDLLRQSMETVLEFTIVVGELQRGRIEEYQASPMIEELYKKFCVKMTMLTKVLKGLVDKNPSRSTSLEDYYLGGSQRPTGGLDALYHLLLRLDLTDWWSTRKHKTWKQE